MASIAVASSVVVGCGVVDGSSSTTSTAAASSRPADGAAVGEPEGAITVAAAASLTDAFTRIAGDFAAANPGVEVTFTFDSSSALATQIAEGAPADVYASADDADMAALTDRGLIAGEPDLFARNEVVIVTKPGNPEGITGLGDLADAGVVSLCGEDVPCGRYAEQVLGAAGVSIPERRVTRGQNVTATLTAVTEGDAVAGIVYSSDAVRAGDTVEAVPIPPGQNVIARYPIGVVATTGSAAAAEAFVAHVTGPEGRRVLEEFGFLPAP
jgi:molybdate transport system substrate-binding protein